MFAAPIDREDRTLSSVFSYVIHVLQGNPEFVPFPTMFTAWTEHGCELTDPTCGLVDGHVEAEKDNVISLIAPGAQKVMVVTEGNQQVQLEKV